MICTPYRCLLRVSMTFAIVILIAGCMSKESEPTGEASKADETPAPVEAGIERVTPEQSALGTGERRIEPIERPEPDTKTRAAAPPSLRSGDDLAEFVRTAGEDLNAWRQRVADLQSRHDAAPEEELEVQLDAIHGLLGEIEHQYDNLQYAEADEKPGLALMLESRLGRLVRAYDLALERAEQNADASGG